MTSILFGAVLLIIGIAATAASPSTIYYGAIVVGVINIVRGFMRLSSPPPAPRARHRR